MNHNKRPTAFELALVAAVIDPKLAKENPAMAVGIARRLMSEAQDGIDYPGTYDRALAQNARAEERDFPRVERVTLTDAFKRWHGHYKTETGFAAALRQGNYTITDAETDEEKTSEHAVETFFRMQTLERRDADRLRKAQSKHRARRKIKNHRRKS